MTLWEELHWVSRLSEEMHLSWTFILRGSQLLKTVAVSATQKTQQVKTPRMEMGLVWWRSKGEMNVFSLLGLTRARLWPRGIHLSIAECGIGGCLRKTYFSKGEHLYFVGTIFCAGLLSQYKLCTISSFIAVPPLLTPGAPFTSNISDTILDIGQVEDLPACHPQMPADMPRLCWSQNASILPCRTHTCQ